MLLCIVAAVGSSLLTAAFLASLFWTWGHVQVTKWAFVLPLAAGLLVGLYVTHIDPTCAGAGVRKVLEFITEKRQPMPFSWLGKWAATLMCLSSGSSGGTAGPSLNVGYAAGYDFARLARLDRKERKIVATGAAAAALGVVLQTPVGAAVFVLEAFYRRIVNYPVLLPAIVANCIGYAVSIHVLGLHPRFANEAFAPSWRIMLLAVATGAVVAWIDILFIRTLTWSARRFLQLPGPAFLRPVLGAALAVAVCAAAVNMKHIRAADVMGPCPMPLRYLYENPLPLEALLIILLVRVLATVLVVSSRNSAGLVTPTMFFGELGGTIAALILHCSLPVMAAAGIAASLAAAFNAPLGAILIMVEMTNVNYTGPITIAAFVSYVIAKGHSILSYRGYAAVTQ